MRRLNLLLLFISVAAFAQSPKRPAITGIAFLRVYASDPAASAAFYGKTLGFHGTESNGLTIYAVNDAQWIEVKPLPSPAPAARMEAVAFTTRNAAALESYLKAHSIPIDQPLKHGTFGVRDPEGNLILFVQQGVRPVGVPAPSPNATSHRIIHAGLLVRDRAAEDRFYRDLLGFRPYWHGGKTDDRTDYVSQQVPDGTDWLEYMLNVSPTPTLHDYGMVDHFSLGTTHMSDVVANLARNKCEGPNCTKTQMGRDGKVQLNLFDPDLTRVEYMEFQPANKPCCSDFTGKHPTETEEH
jgi:catechol 2,3-dioxygenase-like lactoylglutathione lyase family enzyme